MILLIILFFLFVNFIIHARNEKEEFLSDPENLAYYIEWRKEFLHLENQPFSLSKLERINLMLDDYNSKIVEFQNKKAYFGNLK